MEEQVRSVGDGDLRTIWYARVFAVVVGGLTLIYQIWQVSSGNGANQFLVADIVLGVCLIVSASLSARFVAALAMLAAYSYAAGVYVVATAGGLLLGMYDLGVASTTLGLVPCVAFIILLGRWLSSASQQA